MFLFYDGMWWWEFSIFRFFLVLPLVFPPNGCCGTALAAVASPRALPRPRCQGVARGPAPSSRPRLPTSVPLPSWIMKTRLWDFTPFPSLAPISPIRKATGVSELQVGLLHSSCVGDTVAFSSSFLFVMLQQLIRRVKSCLIFKWSTKLSLQCWQSRNQSNFASLSPTWDTTCNTELKIQNSEVKVRTKYLEP